MRFKVAFLWTLFAVCISFRTEGQFADTLSAELRALPQQARAKWLLTRAENRLQSHPAEARKLALNALVLLSKESAPDSVLMAGAHNIAGVAHLQFELYDQAANHLTEAGRILQRHPSDSLLTDVYTSLGILYERNGKYENSLQYYHLVAQMLEKNGAPPTNVARNLTNIGHLYDVQGQLDLAQQYYTRALDICEEHKIAFGRALLNQNLAHILSRKGDLQASLQHSNISIAVALAENFPRIELSGYDNTGTVWEQMGEYAAARRYYHKALSMARSIGYPKVEMNVLRSLASCHEKEGKADSALYYLKAHMTMKDSTHQTENNKRLAGMLAFYENEQKEAVILGLKREADLEKLKVQRQNILIFSLLGGFLLITTSGWLLVNRWRIRKRNEQLSTALQTAEQLRQLEAERNEAEMSALKAQMNPHFIFNALNSIQELFLLGDKRLANEHLGRFSDLTRSILDSSGKKEIRLSEEINLLEDYLSLEQLRFESDFTYSIFADIHTTSDEICLPPMLVQPYVENAIKHGLLHKEGQKHLLVRFRLTDDDVLKVEIEDNGIGREKAAYYAAIRKKGHQSFATAAIKKRLSLLNHGRDRKIGVEIVDLKNDREVSGTLVTLQIPTKHYSHESHYSR